MIMAGEKKKEKVPEEVEEEEVEEKEEPTQQIDPKVQAARIGATVGTRKRRSIIDAADAKGIRVLNRGVL